MARIRTIKPEMAQDAKLASVTREARYTFVLLITQADDDGLIPGAHRQLLGLLYPHDEDVTAVQLLGWLAELENIGAIQWRSTVDGAPVLELTNWSKHQRVDNKGRGHMLNLLVPLADTRREPPRTAATRGISPLGPRTKDLGPRTGESGADAPSVVRLSRGARSSPPWVAEGVTWWLPTVGAMSPAKLHKALASVVGVHGWPAVFADLQKWVAARKLAEKAINVDWYASEASARITAPPPPPLMVDGELTAYGERMTRPDKVPA